MIQRMTTTIRSTASAPRWPTATSRGSGFNAGIAWGNNIGDGDDHRLSGSGQRWRPHDRRRGVLHRRPGSRPRLHFGGSYKAFFLVTEYVTALGQLRHRSRLWRQRCRAFCLGTANWPTPPPFWTRKRSLLWLPEIVGGGRPGAAGNRYIAATSMNVFRGHHRLS